MRQQSWLNGTLPANSCRSSERGREPRRLSEMLDELQAAEGDLGAALPAVGEEEPFLNYISHGISGRTRQGLGLVMLLLSGLACLIETAG